MVPVPEGSRSPPDRPPVTPQTQTPKLRALDSKRPEALNPFCAAPGGGFGGAGGGNGNGFLHSATFQVRGLGGLKSGD